MAVNLERIKEKIRALKNLANDSAATEGEVNAALNMAHKLCREYMLNIDDIEIAKKEFQINSRKFDMKQVKLKVGITMDVAIAHTFHCEMVYNEFFKRYTIYGTDLDIDTTIYMIDLAHNALETSFAKYKRSNEYAELREMHTAKILKRDYFKGFYMGVINKCVDLQKEEKQEFAQQEQSQQNTESKATGTSLILLKNQLVKDKMKEDNPNIKKARKTSSIVYNSNAYQKGKATGQQVQFNTGITNQCLRLRG